MERDTFNASHILENDIDQGWNHAEQSYMHIAWTGVSETSSLVRPVDNTTIPGGNFASQWNAPRSSAYSSSILNAEMPHYPPQAPGPSRDPFLHHSANGTFHTHRENYYHASSSNLGGQTVPGVDADFFFIREWAMKEYHTSEKALESLLCVREALQADITMLESHPISPCLVTHGRRSRVQNLIVHLGSVLFIEVIASLLALKVCRGM